MSTMTIHPTALAPREVRRRTSAPAAPGRSGGQVRLTRRGQVVVVLAALAVVLLLGVWWGAGSVATERPGTPEPTTVVMVSPGDTLYDLAASVTVDGDVAAMVERIQRINALDTGMLQAGQRIRVPVTE